jgi:hypothetical protein
MKLPKVISQLKSQSEAIAELGSGLSKAESQWMPDANSWSIVGTLRHLVYEEIFDFRCYLGKILGITEFSNPELEPDQFKAENSKRSFDDLMGLFLAERERSILWLRSLNEANWDATIGFEWGSLSAGDLLSSWLAHDLLHLRQLIELRYALTQKGSKPYRIEYAGEW